VRTKWLLLAVCAMARAQSLDPLVADPQHYKLEFENQWVRVVRETMGPHEKMPMHQHTSPALIVFLTDRNNRLTSLDGKADNTHNLAGQIQWAPPATHSSENLNDARFEAVRVEPNPVKILPSGAKTVSQERPARARPLAPPAKDEATMVDPETYHVEFENDYVRVIRVTIAPRETGKMHTHPQTGAVVVYLSDQNMRQKLADGQTRENHYKAGQVRWVMPEALAHQDSNLSDNPSRLIRVELKMAR
jgi:quercetin dioxygenase-like cupin family protein